MNGLNSAVAASISLNLTSRGFVRMSEQSLFTLNLNPNLNLNTVPPHTYTHR